MVHFMQELHVLTNQGDLTLLVDSVRRFAESAFGFIFSFVVYIGLIALTMLLVLFILKYIGDSANENEERRNNEHSFLRPPTKTMEITYGTCESQSGDCSYINCTSSSNNDSINNLYDGKICAVCYDEDRNSFFVPCGHCVTCYQCAQRIFSGENRACPVCRRLIGKVRKLPPV